MTQPAPRPSVVLTALMLGLADAIEGRPKRDQPVIAQTQVGGGDPIDLVLDDDPRLTVAFVRPWLRVRGEERYSPRQNGWPAGSA